MVLSLKHLLERARERTFVVRPRLQTLPSESSALDPVGSNRTDDRFLALESCHSTWLFDEEGHRFCRVLKGDLGSSVSTEWRPYDRLVLHPESEAFVVFLDPSGSRLLRSWRHTAHCTRCGGEVTTEMSLDELRKVVSA